MNCISPSPDKHLDKFKTPRKRPVARSPAKFLSLDRGKLPQVEGEIEEGANPDDRSTTGSPGLNENLGTLVPPDQRDVTAPPETSTSPLKKRVLKREPSKPKIPSASGYGPSLSASSTATEGIKFQQRQQDDGRSVNNDLFMIKGPRLVPKTDGKKDQAKTNERRKK